MEFTFFASHMISILQGTLAKSRDPFRFQQRGKYTIPAVHCQRGERSPSASRLGQRHLFQEPRSHWTLAQITWDMEDLCPNRGNPPKRPSGDVSTFHREGRHPGIVRRDWWSVTWGFFDSWSTLLRKAFLFILAQSFTMKYHGMESGSKSK